jgi:hypothetical protein
MLRLATAGVSGILVAFWASAIAASRASSSIKVTWLFAFVDNEKRLSPTTPRPSTSSASSSTSRGAPFRRET